MSDRLEYFKLLEMLWRGYDEVFAPEEVIQSEIGQMQNNEVPYFYTHPCSKDLYDAAGNIIAADIFKTSGFDFIKQRVESMDGDFVIQQLNKGDIFGPLILQEDHFQPRACHQ